jgi:hypothetical protein
MSWSIMFVGSAAGIVAALNKESERLTGDSKKEFDAALPNLVYLVQSNYLNDEQAQQQALRLNANGHAYSENGVPKYGSCNVHLEQLGILV